MHGLTREQLIGKNAIGDLVPPAYREEARANVAKLVNSRISSIEGESLRTDGRSVPVEVRVVRIQYDGQPALLFHVRDITGRQEAETKQLKSETLFRSVWENSVDGMRLTDENGNIVYVNEAFCRITGMKREELEGKPFTVIYADAVAAETMLEQHREKFQKHLVERKVERPCRLHDGREAIFEIADSFVE